MDSVIGVGEQDGCLGFSKYFSIKDKVALKVCLDKHCLDTYSKLIDKYSIVLRISGRISDFKTDGPDRIRLYKKKRECVADFCVPQSKWEGKTPEEVRKLIVDGIRETLTLMGARLTKDEPDYDTDALLADYDKATADYLENHAEIVAGLPETYNPFETPEFKEWAKENGIDLE